MASKNWLTDKLPKTIVYLEQGMRKWIKWKTAFKNLMWWHGLLKQHIAHSIIIISIFLKTSLLVFFELY